jgi:integrase
MARRLTKRLTSLQVTRLGPGMHPDGDGLYLKVAPGGSRSWAFRYKRHGDPHEMGLGPVGTIGLAQARELAIDKRRLLATGIDPIDHRRAEAKAAKAQAARAMSFKDFATVFMDGRDAGLRNGKHRQQWRSTLSTYAYPVLGAVPIADIDVEMVLRVLRPIWASKPETASRVRGRIEVIIDAATAQGLFNRANPARWRGHLAHILPAKSMIRMVTHHAAMDWREVPDFVADLRERAGVAAKALHLAILCASRSGEIRLARWHEFDFAQALWTIPASRMKSKREHRVPLSAQAVALLESLPRTRDTDLVFPGAAQDRPLSDMTLGAVLKRMQRDDVTPHGFRSSFKDFCRERCPHISDAVSEMALAHIVGDRTVQAYGRSDLLDARRTLMQIWADYVESRERADNVVMLHQAGA